MSRVLLTTSLAAAISIAIAGPARAQETSAEIRGQVVDAGGQPVGGVSVVITHAPSGTRTTVTNDAEGYFSVSGLRLGGPFIVSAAKEGFANGEIKDVYTDLSRPQNVTLLLTGTAIENVTVTSSRVEELALGAGLQFSSEDIASMPSVSRDLKDILRADPKIWVDPTNVDAIEIAGTNNRYNTLLVDGIRQNDDFGLNNNGYPTQRSPVSLEWVESVSVQTASFDAEDSFFQGGEIKVVTKSGTNEFEGMSYYYKFDDGLTGDRSKDRTLNFAFEEETLGAAIGGPIIKDKLFFFVGYEKLDRTAPMEFGPTGSSFAVQVPGVTQAEYDQILSISRSVYNFDPGNATDSLPEDDEKYLAKLDWNITDGHRASLSYQKAEGSEIVLGSNTSASLRRVGTPANWYERSFPLEQYSLKLYDRWTDSISTEFKVGRKESTGKQDSLQGTDFAEMIITTPSGGTVYVGPDEFRHANALTNDLNQAEAKVEWLLGNHTLKGGIEYEELDIFNLFVSRSEGQYTFGSIQAFQNRTASRVTYQNAVTNDKDDGAANFKYDITSYYLQDRWQLLPELTLTAGLRYDSYGGSDKPALNQPFTTRYGFANTETFDGRELLSPRLGFNWEVLDRTTLRGGAGLFGGGMPNVWVSNSFSQDGVTVVFVDSQGNAALTPALSNVNGYTLPSQLTDAVAAQAGRGTGTVNAIDPNFEIPSTWRINLGVDHEMSLGFLGDDYRLRFDVTQSYTKDAPLWKNIRYIQTGTAPDGRPIYQRRTDAPAGDDLLLTNTGEGKATVIDFSIEKTWDTDWGRFDLYLGYAHQDVEDVNPATSSTALSNWDNVAVSDINDPGVATSNYEIKHRFPLVLAWNKAFFGDYDTSVGLFFERRSGRPYSITFGTGTSAFGDPRQNPRARQLFYVPRDTSDYGVANGLTQQQVEDYINSSGLSRYRGQIVPRNAFNSPWVTTVDLKLTQALPAFIKDTRAILSLEIENFANLLDNDWGQLTQNSFPYVAPVLDASIVNGRYVYRPIAGTTGPRAPFYSLSALTSVWRMQLGLRVEF